MTKEQLAVMYEIGYRYLVSDVDVSHTLYREPACFRSTGEVAQFHVDNPGGLYRISEIEGTGCLNSLYRYYIRKS